MEGGREGGVEGGGCFFSPLPHSSPFLLSFHLLRIYFIVDIGVAIIISLLPFIGDSYGPAGLWW